jgi:hypothetical protein
MATLSTTRNYAANTVLTEAQLDAAFDSIETFLNTTKLTADNIQNSAITAALIASNAVTTAKINASAVTTAKINDSAVTTAKINDGAVTYAKRVALNYTLSSSSGSQTITSGTYTAITNASAAITTTGRPTLVCLQVDEGVEGYIEVEEVGSSGTANADGNIRFQRDATTIMEAPLRVDFPIDNTITNKIRIPSSSFWTIDFDTGTSSKTYTAQAKINVGTNINIEDAKLLVIEL